MRSRDERRLDKRLKYCTKYSIDTLFAESSMPFSWGTLRLIRCNMFLLRFCAIYGVLSVPWICSICTASSRVWCDCKDRSLFFWLMIILIISILQTIFLLANKALYPIMANDTFALTNWGSSSMRDYPLCCQNTQAVFEFQFKLLSKV